MLLGYTRVSKTDEQNNALQAKIIVIAAVSFVLLLTTKLDTLWIILGASIISLSASTRGLIGRHAL